MEAGCEALTEGRLDDLLSILRSGAQCEDVRQCADYVERNRERITLTSVPKDLLWVRVSSGCKTTRMAPAQACRHALDRSLPTLLLSQRPSRTGSVGQRVMYYLKIKNLGTPPPEAVWKVYSSPRQSVSFPSGWGSA